MYLINGQASETLSVHDRGLHYGDGLFETLAVQNGTPLCWDKHYRRLALGCKRLQFDCPQSDLLLAESRQLAGNTPLLVLKIITTRGEGGRGYRPEPGTPVTRILGVFPWPSHPQKNYTEGVNLRLCKTRLGKNPDTAGIKHLNRLEQVLARGEWDNPEIAEGIMRDTDDNIIEGTMSNIFLIKDNGLLITPDLTNCGITGVIRENILALAPDIGFKTIIKNVSETDLYSADEIFLCNSVIGLWPVAAIEEHEFRPGPGTGRIRNVLVSHRIIVQ